MRFAPKSRMMIRKRINISCGPILNIGPSSLSEPVRLGGLHLG
jgi:hypothetical protein